MLQKNVKSCKIFERNVTSLLLLRIGYEEYPQTLGWVRGLTEKKSKKNLWG